MHSSVFPFHLARQRGQRKSTSDASGGEVNKRYKPSPATQEDGPAGCQELPAMDCSMAHIPSCSPHQQCCRGSRWVPCPQPMSGQSGLNSEIPSWGGCCWAPLAGVDLSPSLAPLDSCRVPMGLCSRGQGGISVGAGLYTKGLTPASSTMQQLLCIDYCVPSPCSNFPIGK